MSNRPETPTDSLKPHDKSARGRSRHRRHKPVKVLRRIDQLTPIIVDENNATVDDRAERREPTNPGHAETQIVVNPARSPIDIHTLRLLLFRPVGEFVQVTVEWPRTFRTGENGSK